MDFTPTPSFYSNLCVVALRFYLTTGNLAELDAAYWYARYAARAVQS